MQLIIDRAKNYKLHDKKNPYFDENGVLTLRGKYAMGSWAEALIKESLLQQDKGEKFHFSKIVMVEDENKLEKEINKFAAAKEKYYALTEAYREENSDKFSETNILPSNLGKDFVNFTFNAGIYNDEKARFCSMSAENLAEGLKYFKAFNKQLDTTELKTATKKIVIPEFKKDVESAYASFKKEAGYMTDAEIKSNLNLPKDVRKKQTRLSMNRLPYQNTLVAEEFMKQIIDFASNIRPGYFVEQMDNK